jgi:DNA ligase-1
MLSHPLEEGDLDTLDISELQVEWKWDGIRVQIAAEPAGTRLFSRSGEDISQSFPEIVEGWPSRCVLDGELLILREGKVAPFADLQKRLGRRSVSKHMLLDLPAHIRLYDALAIDGQDLRTLPLIKRRARLEDWYAANRPRRADLSEIVATTDREALRQVWSSTRGIGIEGLMLKRRSSPYLAGRPKGHWWKWKRAALTLDCVLMYAQRGSGKRSSFYSDYTFGVWRDGPEGQPELVAVGKAYSGFTDAELLRIDRFVRANTVQQFGPVRQVTPELVMEIEFDAVQCSTRHRSGLAMRFPRIHRIRWDKPAADADRLSTLSAMLEPAQGMAVD